MSDKPMEKLHRYVKFHLEMTYKNIVRHFGLTFSASVAVSITLILILVFILLTSNLNNFTKYIEQQVTIRVSVDTIVKDKRERQLLHAVERLNTVKHITLSTGKEELKNYKTELQDGSTMFDMYEEKADPIHDTFLIGVKDGKGIQKTANKIENMKGIVSVEYGGDSTGGMTSTFEKIREGGMIFIIFLIVIAVLLISNKIKMSIYTRKQEIAIMRFVGAGNWVIKFPMILEGILIGILGSLVPVLLTISGCQYVYTILGGTFTDNAFILQTIFPMTLEISGILILIGVLVGLVGGFFFTTGHLHWKR